MTARRFLAILTVCGIALVVFWNVMSFGSALGSRTGEGRVWLTINYLQIAGAVVGASVLGWFLWRRIGGR